MPTHSRWVGRLACGCVALVAAAMLEVSPSAAGLSIFSTVGTEPDPLVGPFPLSLHPGQSTSVGVSLFTGQGSGFVKPSVSCCVDATTGAQVTPAGLTIGFRLPTFAGRRGRGGSPGIYLTPGATEVATLTVTADTSAAPGQYAVKISASHPAMGSSEQTIFVNVLGPTPADDTVTPCSSQVNNVVVGNGTPPVAQVLPLMGVVDSVFGVKATNPGKISFQVGAQTTDSRNGWAIALEREDPIPQSPLKINQAIIALSNDSPGDKDLWTVNGGACGTASVPQHIHVAQGQSARITISKSSVTSLILRRDVCTSWFIICWGTMSEPVAVFTQPGFWSFVGGRVVTLRWFHST